MREWFVNIAGESYASALMWTVAALVLLLILLVLIRIVRSFTFGTFVAGGRNRRPRLAVTDATAVDSHRRLVLVRRDDVEHLILIGGPSDVVIEQNIRQFSEEPAFEAEEDKPKREPVPIPTPAPAAREAPREEIRSVPPSAPIPAPTAPVPSPAPVAQSATVVPLKAEAAPAVQPRQEVPRPQAIAATAAAAAAAPRREAADDRNEVEIDESVFELAEAEITASTPQTVSPERQAPRQAVAPAAPMVDVSSMPAAQADSGRTEEAAYSDPMIDEIDIGTGEPRKSETRKQPDESLEDEMSRLLEELSDNRR